MAKFAVIVVGQPTPIEVEADDYCVSERWLAFERDHTVVFRISVPRVISVRRAES